MYPNTRACAKGGGVLVNLCRDRLHTNSFGNLVSVDGCFVITVLFCNYCPYCNNALTLPTMSFAVCYSRVPPLI